MASAAEQEVKIPSSARVSLHGDSRDDINGFDLIDLVESQPEKKARTTINNSDGSFGVDVKYEVIIEPDDGIHGRNEKLITPNVLSNRAGEVDSSIIPKKFRSLEKGSSSIDRALTAARRKRQQKPIVQMYVEKPLKETDRLRELEDRMNTLERRLFDRRINNLEMRTAKIERIFEKILSIIGGRLGEGKESADSLKEVLAEISCQGERSASNEWELNSDSRGLFDDDGANSDNLLLDPDIQIKSEGTRAIEVIIPEEEEEEEEDEQDDAISFQEECNEETVELGGVSTKSNQNESKPFACNQCGYKAKYKSTLTRHKRLHKDRPYCCSQCAYKTANKSELEIHIRIHTGEPFSCSQCDYTTTNITYYRKHKRKHEVGKPFACGQCSFRGHRKHELEYHSKIHSGEKPFACNMCDYRCLRKFELRFHQRRHTGVKPFECDQCNFKASKLANLQQHIRTHTGEKPFACEYCDYRASAKNLLKYHTRKHTGYKPYKCEHCDYRANSVSHLNFHMKSHTGEKPYACSVCSYRAKSKHQITVHLKTHTGEKPFECDICDYRTSRKDYLKRHKELHSGVGKKLSCNLCDYKTPSRKDLQIHKESHNEEEHSYCVIIDGGEIYG